MRTASTSTAARAQLLVLAVLALAFTLALTFATLELPRVLSNVLIKYYPDVPTDVLRGVRQPQNLGAFMDYARPAGYALLLIVFLLILIGFISGRRILSSLGSFALFLPAFGYFAASMFLLAGLGILRVIWLPFWDSAPILLELGDIAYLPFWIATYVSNVVLGATAASSVGSILANLAIVLGLMIFWAGTFSWLYGKLKGKRVFDFWIYKYSRHPQYLGFIVWSYGVTLSSTLAPNPFWIRQPEPTLPWLISALLLICVALSEEITMAKHAGRAYARYRTNSPFMLPLPPSFSKLFLGPNRAIMGKDMPENGKEILYTFVIYCTSLILLSILFLALNWPQYELHPSN